MMSELQIFAFRYPLRLLRSFSYPFQYLTHPFLNSKYMSRLSDRNLIVDFFSKISEVNKSFFKVVFITHKFPNLMSLKFMDKVVMIVFVKGLFKSRYSLEQDFYLAF